MTEGSFDTGTVVLNYARGPASGVPLVLLHGGNARWQFFDPILPALVEGWRVYAPDLRGQGMSGRVPGRYRLQDYADDIAAFMRGCVGEPAHLFGVSLGGIVALMVAARAPAAVRSVVVGDAPLTGATWVAALNQTRDQLAGWRELAGGMIPIPIMMERLKEAPVVAHGQTESRRMREVYGESSPVYAWLAENLYRTDPDFFAALLDEPEVTAAGYEMASVLPAIACPVLLLQADPASGGALGDAEVEEALSLLARPEHVRLAGISHLLFNHPEGKEPVLDAVTAFLASVDRAPDSSPSRG